MDKSIQNTIFPWLLIKFLSHWHLSIKFQPPIKALLIFYNGFIMQVNMKTRVQQAYKGTSNQHHCPRSRILQPSPLLRRPCTLTQFHSISNLLVSLIILVNISIGRDVNWIQSYDYRLLIKKWRSLNLTRSILSCHFSAPPNHLVSILMLINILIGRGAS